MTVPKRLMKKLEDFLYERSESEGGYAPVGDKDLQKFGEIIEEIVKAKYGEDPDGDLPVNFELFDRTRYIRPYFSPIPHFHKSDGDMKVLLTALRAATGNLETVQDQVKTITRQIGYDLEERMDTGKTVNYGGTVYEKFLPNMKSRDDLLSQLEVALARQVKSNPLSEQDLEDYQAKQKWERKLSDALTKKLDTNVAVSCYMRRSADDQGNVRVVAKLVSLGYSNPNTDLLMAQTNLMVGPDAKPETRKAPKP